MSALEVIQALKRGECWCEVAIGNPMVTSHSRGCIMAQTFIAEEEWRRREYQAALKRLTDLGDQMKKISA